MKPQGTEIPGIPARLAVTVKMSQRYIWSGSAVFSPDVKAGNGEVGPAITSHVSNAFRKSSWMRRRTFSART